MKRHLIIIICLAVLTLPLIYRLGLYMGGKSLKIPSKTAVVDNKLQLEGVPIGGIWRGGGIYIDSLGNFTHIKPTHDTTLKMTYYFGKSVNTLNVVLRPD